MAKQCRKMVYVVMHDDDTNHLVTYNSSPADFTLDRIETLLNRKEPATVEQFDDSNYDFILDQPYLKVQ